MKRLITSNPFLILLLEIVLVAVAVLLFVGCISVFQIENTKYCLIIIVALFLAGYFFWINLIAMGFHILATNSKKDSKFKKFQLALITQYTIVILSFSLTIYFETNTFDQILVVVSILFSLLSFFCLGYIIVHLTNNFKFFDKKGEPRFWDYFVSMFLLSFFPFGLMIMHDHLRLIMKENVEYRP